MNKEFLECVCVTLVVLGLALCVYIFVQTVQWWFIVLESNKEARDCNGIRSVVTIKLYKKVIEKHKNEFTVSKTPSSTAVYSKKDSKTWISEVRFVINNVVYVPLTPFTLIGIVRINKRLHGEVYNKECGKGMNKRTPLKWFKAY